MVSESGEAIDLAFSVRRLIRLINAGSRNRNLRRLGPCFWRFIGSSLSNRILWDNIGSAAAAPHQFITTPRRKTSQPALANSRTLKSGWAKCCTDNRFHWLGYWGLSG